SPLSSTDQRGGRLTAPGGFREGRPGFAAQKRRSAPPSLALLGKRAFSAMIDQSDVELGRHPTRFAGATAWVLPNPSGFNKAFTLDGLWRLVDGPPRRTVAAGVLIMMAADDTHRDRRAG